MKRLATMLAGTALLLMTGTALATPTYPTGYNASQSALWTFTDSDYSKTTGFTLYLNSPTYRSDFGLFNVNDTTNPTAIKGDVLSVISYDQAPNFGPLTNASVKFRYNADHWEASVNGTGTWKAFDPVFGFYFGVHTSGPEVDYRYYTLTSLNGTDPGQSHIAIGYDQSTNTAAMYLEGSPFSKGDFDFNDGGLLISDLAPVPEPGTMVLLGVGFLCLAIYGKRRRNS